MLRGFRPFFSDGAISRASRIERHAPSGVAVPRASQDCPIFVRAAAPCCNGGQPLDSQDLNDRFKIYT
jgi:hypothetical protein